MKPCPTLSSPAKRKRGRPFGARSWAISLVPRRLALREAERRPLVPPSAAALLLDKSAEQILALVEDGALRWAFDIRAAKSKRRAIRVLRQSVYEFAGVFAWPENPRGETQEFARVINLILSGGETRFVSASPGEPAVAAMRGTFVQQCLSCHNHHVRTLISEHSLQAIQHPGGRKKTPLITRASLIEFLKQRKIA